jgi:hypothetical protein
LELHHSQDYCLFVYSVKTLSVSKIQASSGNLHGLKFLQEHGCTWNGRTFNAAASSGNLDMLKYLKEQFCNWDERTSLPQLQVEIWRW